MVHAATMAISVGASSSAAFESARQARVTAEGRKLDIRKRAFVPPAWLLSPAGRQAVGAAGFEFYETFGGIVHAGRVRAMLSQQRPRHGRDPRAEEVRPQPSP